MKKGKIHFIPLLFSALLAAVLFYVAVRSFFDHFWGFDIISERHWKHILNKWQDGWVIRKPKEVFFFISLLSLIPCYFCMWWLVYIWPWKKIFLFPLTYLENRKKAKLQAQSLAAALGPADRKEALAAKKEPEKVIKISSEKLHHIDHLRGKGAAVSHSAAAAPHQDQPAAASSGETVDRFTLWESLEQSLEAENIFVLRQMQIRSFPVNLFAITESGLFLLCEGPELGTVWETDDEAVPAVWITENKDKIPSPLRNMLVARGALKKYFKEKMPQYADLNVNCCLILDHGDISNTDKMLTFLDKWDISVLRMGSCKTSALPDRNALIEYIKSQPASSQELNDAVAVAILDLMEPEIGE